MDPVDERARDEAIARLKELIAISRRYETFAHENPLQATAQLAELNFLGLLENAWNLLWVPAILRAKTARAAGIIVLELCGTEGDPEHEPGLMDILMPAAILASCVVAQTYGMRCDIPSQPPSGFLEVLARLLRRVTIEQPGELEAIANSHSAALMPVLPPIVAVLPPHVRVRLIGLAYLLAGQDKSIGPKVVTTIFTVGAVVTESFEPLNC